MNINIDHAELTRHQANTIPLHGDARATIEVLLPLLIEAGAEERPSPAEAVTAARKLIAMTPSNQRPVLPVPAGNVGAHPRQQFDRLFPYVNEGHRCAGPCGPDSRGRLRWASAR